MIGRTNIANVKPLIKSASTNLRNPFVLDAILSALAGGAVGAASAGEGRRLKGTLAGGLGGLVGASAATGAPRMGLSKLKDQEALRKVLGAGIGGLTGGLIMQPQVHGLNHLAGRGAIDAVGGADNEIIADRVIADALRG